MPSVTTTFTTFAEEDRAGSIGGVDTEDWNDPGNAQSNDAARAAWSTSVFPPWNGYTVYLTAKQLTDLVPGGAVIEGVRATIVKRKSASGSGTWQDSAVFLIVGGTVQTGTNKATTTAYTTSDAGETYGDPTDKWGLALSAADVNGAGFGVALSCGIAGAGFGDTDVPQINAVTVEVFYSLPTGAKGDLMLTGSGD
ncbi:MAG: hypothetical protein WD716_13445 [Fimbriimonadaceae bacterium]